MKRMIPVDREAHAKALKNMLRAARAAIAKGRQIVIYPEGTRQELDAPPDYKPGIAAMYRDLNLPVTPIALNTGLVLAAERHHAQARHRDHQNSAGDSGRPVARRIHARA